ncbi:hypothetical protein [Nitrosovibrio sp. Nv6]
MGLQDPACGRRQHPAPARC